MKRTIALPLLLAIPQSAMALAPEPGSLFDRDIDTGAALCCVIKTPDNRCMIYDPGHYASEGWRAWGGVRQLHPTGIDKNLLRFSNSDSDHIRTVKRIRDDDQVAPAAVAGSL